MRVSSLARGPVAAVVLAVLASFTPGDAIPLRGQQPPMAAHVANELLVRFRADLPAARQDVAIAGLAGTIMRRFASLGVVRVRLRPGMTAATAVALAQADPDVLAVATQFHPPRRCARRRRTIPYWVDRQPVGPDQDPGAGRLDRRSPPAAPRRRRRRHRHRRQLQPPRPRRQHVAQPRRNRRQRRRRRPQRLRGRRLRHRHAATTTAIPMDDNGHGTHTAGTIAARRQQRHRRRRRELERARSSRASSSTRQRQRHRCRRDRVLQLHRRAEESRREHPRQHQQLGRPSATPASRSRRR